MSMIVQPSRFAVLAPPVSYTTLDASANPPRNRDDLSSPRDLTLSNGDLTVSRNDTSGASTITGVHGKKTGKWRYQVTINALPNPEISLGVAGPAFTRDVYLGYDIHGAGMVSDGRQGSADFFPNSGLGGMAPGDVIDIYFDADAKRVWFGKNGAVSGSPTDGTGGVVMNGGAIGAFYPALYLNARNSVVTCNFGSAPFTHGSHPAFVPWTATAPSADRTNFRSAMFFIYDYGWYAHAVAEFMLRAESGGTNLLAGGTASARASNNGTTAAMGLDGNEMTAWLFSNGQQNQGHDWFFADMGAMAERNAAFIALQAREGTGGEHRQAPRSVDLFFSSDGVSYEKGKMQLNFGVGLESWNPQSPGQIKELSLV